MRARCAFPRPRAREGDIVIRRRDTSSIDIADITVGTIRCAHAIARARRCFIIRRRDDLFALIGGALKQCGARPVGRRASADRARLTGPRIVARRIAAITVDAMAAPAFPRSFAGRAILLSIEQHRRAAIGDARRHQNPTVEQRRNACGIRQGIRDGSFEL